MAANQNEHPHILCAKKIMNHIESLQEKDGVSGDQILFALHYVTRSILVNNQQHELDRLLAPYSLAIHTAFDLTEENN